MVAILGLAFVVMIAITVQLVKKGAALRSAGVIKPMLVPEPVSLIGESLALRLFPHFQSAKNVYWISSGEMMPLAQVIAKVTHERILMDQKPKFIMRDLLQEGEPSSEEEVIWIYVLSFRRGQSVPPECEEQQILNIECLKAVSVREVNNKFSEPQPYFFMRRYLDNRFYLLIEK